jgi:hypothetical protein
MHYFGNMLPLMNQYGVTNMIDLTKLNITERRKVAGEQSLYRNDARKSGHVDDIEETITEERLDYQ